MPTILYVILFCGRKKKSQGEKVVQGERVTDGDELIVEAKKNIWQTENG